MKVFETGKYPAIDLAFLVLMLLMAYPAIAQDSDPFVAERAQFTLGINLLRLDSCAVLDVNSSERHTIEIRKAAVQFIEVVYNYRMLDINNLAADKDYYVRLRFGIYTDELPLSLKSGSLWDNDRNLQSDWYEWEVKRPEL